MAKVKQPDGLALEGTLRRIEDAAKSLRGQVSKASRIRDECPDEFNKCLPSGERAEPGKCQTAALSVAMLSTANLLEGWADRLGEMLYEHAAAAFVRQTGKLDPATESKLRNDARYEPANLR